MSADGTWKVTMNTPMGAQEASLTFATHGEALTGNMTSPQGAVEITDGKVDGDSLQWKAAIAQPMPLTLEFDAKIDGDAISGDVKLGAFGNATFAGARA